MFCSRRWRLFRLCPERFFPSRRRRRQLRQADLLPSWNDGPAKQAIFDFVRATIDRSSPSYVFPEDRIAVFDQDGTLWVEHPMYSQMMYCLERVPVLAAQKPALKNAEPFKTVLSGNRDAIAKLIAAGPRKDHCRHALRHDDRRVQCRSEEMARHSEGPALEEVLYRTHLPTHAGGDELLSRQRLKTYIVTGFGQDFVRVYSQQIYGIPPEQVIGSALSTKYGYGKDGKPILTKEPKLLLNDNFGGKPESIDLIIGRRPYAAFGNSTGDQQMLEYTGAGDGARLKMLVLHDDATREYAYGPAQGLPDTKVGTFTQALYEEANKNGWTVISMKNDWKRIFSFE